MGGEELLHLALGRAEREIPNIDLLSQLELLSSSAYADNYPCRARRHDQQDLRRNEKVRVKRPGG
jgi:hypothetical protein